jgi:hypothetical protein
MPPRRVYAVYRNDAGDSAKAAFDPNRQLTPPQYGMRGMDVAFDVYDADTGELVKRGTTPREEMRRDGWNV